MNVLEGVDLASMDEWAQRHGHDPRSKKKDGWLDETEQATLFRWLSRNEKHLVVSNPARRGAPRAIKLDFGEGHRLEHRVRIRFRRAVRRICCQQQIARRERHGQARTFSGP